MDISQDERLMLQRDGGTDALFIYSIKQIY